MNFRSSQVRIFDSEIINKIILKIILYPLTIIKKKKCYLYNFCTLQYNQHLRYDDKKQLFNINLGLLH